MKTKRLENKRVLRLNKTTIVNLNHREMVKIKVGVGEGAQVNIDSEARYSRWCTLDTVPHETLHNYSFVKACTLTGHDTECLMPATDTC
jgi:hypothetical protein